MFQKNRIVALIDFSESSEALLKFTSEFAGCIDAKVVLLHRVQGMVPAMSNPASKMELLAYEKQNASKKLRKLADGFFSKGVDLIVSDRSIASLLENLEKEEYFNWVFTGLKGTSLLKRFFLGSTILEVVDETALLTVAFPVQKEIYLPETLVVATHYKFPINKSQLEGVLWGLQEKIKKIDFISFVAGDEEEAALEKYMEELRNYFKNYDPATSTFRGKDAFAEIKEYMKTREDAFLVVQQGSRSLTDSLFRKFMINELVYNGATPLIILSQ